MELDKYISEISVTETTDIPLGVKNAAGEDVFVKLLKSQKWGDFIKFITEFTALEGKTDPESLQKSKNLTMQMICKMVVNDEGLTMQMICKMVVNDEGKNYLTLELLNRMPATLVARIEAAVSNYILEVGKNKNVEEIKKN